MQRILFVDDDPAVLQGLRRMLHDQRGAWEMAFCGSGPEALAELDARPAQVVVTDMRMPGMDGAELLKLVRARHPEALRIVLSGQTDWDRAAQSVEDAHQFLLKPCEKERLKEAIQRSESVAAMVPDAALRSDIARLSCLPMLGPSARDLLAELDRPDASPKRAAALVERDPGLAAMALKMVHSAFFALPVRVERPSQAALLLGMDNLRGLLLGSEPMRRLEQGSRALAEKTWQRGIDVAYEARRLAGVIKAGADVEAKAFTAGMLHEIGVLVLAGLRPALARDWDQRHPGGWPGGAEEKALFGADHAAAGAYLLALWGLPPVLFGPVAWHHDPQWGKKGCPVLAVLHTAALGQDKQEDYLLASAWPKLAEESCTPTPPGDLRAREHSMCG
jgi:HD-like signal output (HDOD) protein